MKSRSEQGKKAAGTSERAFWAWLPPSKDLALAVFGGLLYWVGFVGFGQLYLSWVCFVPALYVLSRATPRTALTLGVVYGAVLTLGGFYWIAHMLREFADLGWFLSLLGLFLLAAYHGLGFGLVFWLTHRARVRCSWAYVWALPVAVAAHELAFPELFPFYLGASQYRFVAITQIVELTGMAGLAALIAFVNGALFELWEARRDGRRLGRARVLLPAAAFAGCLGFGVLRIAAIDRAAEQAPKLKVAVIQTNLGAKDKAARASDFIRRHVDMSREVLAKHPDVDLLVWPESAYNRWIPRSTTNVSRLVTQGLDRPVLFGALTWEGGEASPRSYNSAVLTSSTGDVLGIFDKVVLLAFGERIPLVHHFPFLKRWLPRSDGFTAGTQFEHLRLKDGTRMLPMVCYEDILPGFVREMWRRGGPADLLVNLTNDSWYGDSHEPLEHLALATFRSIETRRALVRSTNTGISALVDPVGRLTARTGQWTQEALIGDVPLLIGGPAPLYQTVGDWFGYLALVGALWITMGFRLDRRAR